MRGVRGAKHNDRPAGPINQLWSRKPHHTRKHTYTLPFSLSPLAFLLFPSWNSSSPHGSRSASITGSHQGKTSPKSRSECQHPLRSFRGFGPCRACIRSRGRSPSNCTEWFTRLVRPTSHPLSVFFISRWSADQQTPVWWSAIHQTGNYIPRFQPQFEKKDRGETKHWALPSLVSARGEITEIITAVFQLYGRVEFQQLHLNNMYAL